MATIKDPQYWERRKLMDAAGVSNVSIAESESVTETYVSLVVTGNRTGYRIRRAIAAAVGRPVEELWPDTPPERRAA